MTVARGIDSTDEIGVITLIVRQIMQIQDITRGDPKKDYLVRYRGEIYGDTAQAYERLSDMLKAERVTPLFRREGDQQSVLIMPGVIEPKPSNPWVNVVLFLATLLSMIFAGALSAYSGSAMEDTFSLLREVFRSLPSGIPFAVSLLGILATHEFGHYLAGRFHHTHVTLPYFIPFPLSPFGTMGAFIQLKEPPRNKRILLDIGIAGPIAGLIVAIPVLIYGLSLSTVETISLQPGEGFMLEGNSLLYLMAKFLVFGKLLPAPASFGDISPMILLGALFLHKPTFASWRTGCDDPPGSLGRVGWTACDGFEPDPCWATRWRTHPLCAVGQESSEAPAFHPGSLGGTGLRMVWLVVVGRADLSAWTSLR